jgi:cellulose synthase/poly-beta-1,6-N-acetylglucosamine synthase-like glycosyltransferase
LNCGPENLSDYFKQRRRIFAGHLYVRDRLGYQVSTMNGLRIAWLFLQNLKFDWRYFSWAPFIILMEIAVRLLASYDYNVRKRNPYVWPVVESTKNVSKVSPMLHQDKP